LSNDFNDICCAISEAEKETNKVIKIPKLEFSLAEQKLSITKPDCRAAGLLNAKVTWHL